MHCDLHTAITLCEQSVMIQSISLHDPGAKAEKGYYQHRHPGFELHYVSVGSCRVNCESKSYHLNAGAMLIIPPGVYHDLVDADKETTRISISFSLNAPKSKNAESKKDMFACSFYRGDLFFADLENTDILPILQKIEGILSHSPEGLYKRDRLLALCGILLLELAEFTKTDTPLLQPPNATGDVLDAAFKIDGFLGRNFMCNNAMPRMAEELHISTRQLHRMIRKHYQINYRQKLSENIITTTKTRIAAIPTMENFLIFSIAGVSGKALLVVTSLPSAFSLR